MLLKVKAHLKLQRKQDAQLITFHGAEGNSDKNNKHTNVYINSLCSVLKTVYMWSGV